MPKGIPKNGTNKGWIKKQDSDNNYKGNKIYYDKKGYPVIWLNGTDRKVHILVWEEVNERSKLEGYEIHHKDFDKKNYDINNLELLTNSDHQRVHAGWEREKGEWVGKPCKICKQVLALELFYPRETLKNKTPSNICRDCSKEVWSKDARLLGIKTRNFIKSNEKGDYKCSHCNEWKIKDLFKLNQKHIPNGYCKACFNKYQNQRNQRRYCNNDTTDS